MRKFVVPKTSTVKVDVEQARVERAVMAAKATAPNSSGLSWPPPLKKRRVGRPSRRDLYVDAVCKHIDEHVSVSAIFTLDVPVWWVRGMVILRTEADVEKAHSEIFEETVDPDAKRRKVTESFPKRKKVVPQPDVKAWFMCH